MVLVGLLSNHETTARFQSLTQHDWRQERVRPRRRSGVAPDGRRKFGAIRDAILVVLKEAEGDLRVREIHARVEAALAEPVSHGSVKAYLRVGCKRKVPLFEHRGKAGYRLARM